MTSLCVHSPADYKYNHHCYGRGPFYSVHEWRLHKAAVLEGRGHRSPGPNECAPRLPVCSGRLHWLREVGWCAEAIMPRAERSRFFALAAILDQYLPD